MYMFVCGYEGVLSWLAGWLSDWLIGWFYFIVIHLFIYFEVNEGIKTDPKTTRNQPKELSACAQSSFITPKRKVHRQLPFTVGCTLMPHLNTVAIFVLNRRNCFVVVAVTVLNGL